jgi:hypothetical protein
MPRTKATARHAKKRPRSRSMSTAHKRALADGRAISATVGRYLSAVNTPQRRGRKVSKETLERRLTEARASAKTAVGVEKVLASQAVRDLQAKLTRLNASSDADIKTLEAAFVKIARKFSDSRGIAYGAWRDAGVPVDVLRRAGIARARG